MSTAHSGFHGIVKDPEAAQRPSLRMYGKTRLGATLTHPTA